MKIFTPVQTSKSIQSEQDRAAYLLRYILFMSLMGAVMVAVISALVNWSEPLFISLATIINILVLFYFVHRNMVQLCSHLYIISMLCILTLTLARADGIHDTAVFVFPVISLVASQLVDYKKFYFYTLLAILILGIVTIFQYNEYLPIPFTRNDLIMQFALVSFMLIVIAVMSRLLFISLLANLENARLNEVKYRNIYNNIQDVYYEMTLEGTLLHISPSVESLSHYKSGELIGRNIDTLFKQEDKGVEFLTIIKKWGKIVNYENQLSDKDGAVRHTMITAQLLAETEDTPARIVGSIRDITDKKRLENQILQIRKMESIGLLAGSIAKKLKELSESINSQCKNIALHSKINQFNDNFKEIFDTGEKISFMSHQLLTFSENQSFKPQVININSCIEGIKPVLEKLLEPSTALDFDLVDDLPSIHADPGQIEQVLANLIRNAQKALNSKKEIKSCIIAVNTDIRTIDEKFVQSHSMKHIHAGDYILLSVSDNGIGMTKDVQQNIFEPFFTLTTGASGLGLSMVYGIVQQNHGFINVYSEPGHGSTFHVYWPVVSKETAVSETVSVFQSGHESIVLVEDDTDFLNFITEALKSFGYQVYTFTDAPKALEFIKSGTTQVDLLITDYVLPGMDGKELIRHVIQFDAKLPIILTSGFGDKFLQQDFITGKDMRFLQKPFSVHDLLTRVREALENMGN